MMTLLLDPGHWRRHDKGYWAQVIAGAIDEAAPDIMRAEAYELRETTLLVRARANLPPKAMKKRLREDESFRRLRARLVDLGADPDFEVENAAG